MPFPNSFTSPSGTLNSYRDNLIAYTEEIAYPEIRSGVLTLDMTESNVFVVNHGQNIATLNLIASESGCTSGTLHLTQDATGGRTFTFPASPVVQWSSGTAPPITTTANKTNVFTFFKIENTNAWLFALVGKDYA